MKKRYLLFVALSLLLSACGPVHVEGTIMSVADATATAAVQRSPAVLDIQPAQPPSPAAIQSQPAPLIETRQAQPPDLGRLAYVQGGDIWVKDLPTGEPQRLTQDGRNLDPRWSPSGEWIAFRKEDATGIWIVRSDGSADAHPVKGSTTSEFAWSPVVDDLAFAVADRLMVTDPAGLAPQTLISAPADATEQSQIGRIAWSPDGAWIAYELATRPAAGPMTAQGIWRIAAQGGKPSQIYASNVPEEGEAVLAGWTSDGQTLLFWQSPVPSASVLADGVPLYALPVDGGEPTQLADAVLVHPNAVAPAPAGTPHIAVVAGSGRETWTNKALQVTATNGGSVTLSPPDQAVSAPAWSPNGEFIVFSAMPDAGSLGGGEAALQAMMGRKLWIADSTLDGSRLQLTGDLNYRDEAPVWSADGRHLLFVRMDGQGKASLWLISAEDEAPIQIVDELTPAPDPSGYYGHVEWDVLFEWRQEPLTGSQFHPTATPIPVTAARSLAAFLPHLTAGLTAARAIEIWGEPDEITGNDLAVYKYQLADGLVLWLGFSALEPIRYAKVEGPDGSLTDLALRSAQADTEPGALATPTPVPAGQATSTPVVVPVEVRATQPPVPAEVGPTVPPPPTVPPGTDAETATPIPTATPVDPS